MLIKNKKAALVQYTLITIIILLVSAAIVLLFFKAFPFEETIDKEACRTSVALRNEAYLRGENILPEIVPLKCKTEKITITTENEEIIKRNLANAMYDCWWMMGEGKMQPFAESTWRSFAIPNKGNAESACVICSTIDFDKGAKNKRIDLLPYLVTSKIPLKDITYFEYFTDKADKGLATQLNTVSIDTNKRYTVVFMGIRGKNFWDVLKADAGALGLTAGATVFVGGGKVISKLIGVASKIPVWGWAVIGALTVGTVVTQGITTAWDNAYVASRCDGEWEGCYQIILSELTPEQINNICRNIESIP